MPTAKPESVELSPEKLARIGPAMQAPMTDHKVAGAITMITRRDKIVYFEAFGQRDIDSGQPMERDTMMRFYSMSKPITSVAIMMLMEDGKLDLDDPVAKHLPELRGVKVFLRANGDGFATERRSLPLRRSSKTRYTCGQRVIYIPWASEMRGELYILEGLDHGQMSEPARPLRLRFIKKRAKLTVQKCNST